MNFINAKKIKMSLEQARDLASKTLSERYPEKGPMGLTPDHIKYSPSFQLDKFAFDEAHENLRNFNTFLLKNFKKELREERRIKHNNRMKGIK